MNNFTLSYKKPKNINTYKCIVTIPGDTEHSGIYTYWNTVDTVPAISSSYSLGEVYNSGSSNQIRFWAPYEYWELSINNEVISQSNNFTDGAKWPWEISWSNGVTITPVYQ